MDKSKSVLVVDTGGTYLRLMGELVDEGLAPDAARLIGKGIPRNAYSNDVLIRHDSYGSYTSCMWHHARLSACGVLSIRAKLLLGWRSWLRSG